MIQKIVHKIMRPRHFWRDIGFDELSELYTSMLIRSLATSLIGLFVPIYLYSLGFSVRTIFGFFIIFFIVRIFCDVISALTVARIGPKHTIALSTLANIVFLLLLLTLKDLHWPLAFVAIVGSLTNSLFFIAFHTDFSKIKHPLHGGKELGYLTILEKIGGILGPLIGGVIATVFSPSYTIVIAIILFIISLIPLFMTNEPVKTHQHITLKGFKWRPHIREFVSYTCLNTENVISILLWNFYLAIAIFTKDPYAKIGAITAISTALSLLSVRVVGVRVDNKSDRKLLHFGVVVNSFIHLLRVFVRTPLGALGINVLNDPITVTYRMPFVKQFYDFSDDVPGYRIVYIAANEMISAIAKACVWAGLYIASAHVSEITAMKGAFVVGALFSLGIALQPKPYNNHRQQVEHAS